MVEDRWVYAARRLTSIESSFQPCGIYRDYLRGVPRGGQNVQKCAKMANFQLTGWITGKRLKIDGYMLRCIWQALNPLFIHVTFTAIVPGANELLSPSCIWIKTIQIRPCRGNTNRMTARQLKTTNWPKCVLNSLEVAKCLHPQNGWRQRHTAHTIALVVYAMRC